MKLIKKFNRYISALFIMTIVITALTSYYTFNRIVHSHVQLQQQATVPLFSVITNEIIRPLTVASFMAKDQFLIDATNQESLDLKTIHKYLENLTSNYGMMSFVASEKHHMMIDSDNKVLDLDNDQAEWYHRIKALPSPQYFDFGNADNPHLYFDIKMFDKKEQFLGITGVGIDLDHFANAFMEFQERFGVELIFVDEEGIVTLTSNHLMKTDGHHRKEEQINVSTLPWHQAYYSHGVDSTDVMLPEMDLIISVLPIPEIDWKVYILIPPATAQSEYWQIFIQKMLIIFLVAIVLTVVCNFTLNKFRTNLAKDSETDFLTNLPTRGFVHWHYEQLQAEHQVVSVVIADIDKFKDVNDNYGHLTGDNVLKAIAEHIHDNMRSIDIVGRWGGEEFIMLLPGINANKAGEVIERLRLSIETLAIPAEKTGLNVNITSSFGITDGNIQEKTLEQLIAKADKGLYQAKSNGRNCSVIYS